MSPHRIGINFNEIRPLNGHRHEGFEELTVSLFRADFGELVRRIDGAGGDGGIEAYVRNPDEGLIGFQAKYFIDRFGPRQFAQIKDSIQTAIQNHPSLSKYIVACPQDFTTKGDERWNAIVEDIRSTHPDVHLVYWGQSKLFDLLTETKHSGRRAYWFETPAFDHAWVEDHSLTSIRSLDMRYTPASHVDVEAGEIISAFASDTNFIGRYYEEARSFWKAWVKGFEGLTGSGFTDGKFSDFNVAVTSARVTGEGSLPIFGAGVTLPVWTDLNAAVQSLSDALREIERQVEKVLEPDEGGDGGGHKPGHSAFRAVREIESALYDFISFSEKFESAGSNRLLLSGEAGSGKSHTLAKECQTRDPELRVASPR